MHGWLPVTVQVIAAVALIAAVSRRSGRWQVRWLPWALIVGGAAGRVGLLVRRLPGAGRQPRAARAVDLDRADRLRGGGPGGRLARARWWRRGVSLAALPLCLLCAALALNLWVGYFPTVQTAWNQLTAGPLPDQTDQVTVMAMQQAAQDPAEGHRGAGRHQRRGIGFQAPRRAGLPAAGLVRHQPAAAAADGDDDRRRVQHPRRLAAHRRARSRRSTISPRRITATHL